MTSHSPWTRINGVAAKPGSAFGSALRIGRALLASQYALMLEYRAEILLWALSGLLPLLMYSLWSGAPAGAAAGISPQVFARYFLAAFVIRQFTVVWVVYAFEEIGRAHV